MIGRITLSLMFVLGGCGSFALAEAAEPDPWPASVPDFVAPKPGEHPRLLFRERDLPELRRRAKTPHGRALIARLRVLLDGGDGTTIPDNLGMNEKPSRDGTGELIDEPDGAVYTFSHPAGYGFLYQLTGEQKYADLGLRAFEIGLEGYRGRDRRYSFREPYGALRAGPTLGWYALGYDLCYDGWDQPTRRRIARAIAGYDEGRRQSLPELVKGSRFFPGSNHWGMQVGGGAMALLAVLGDPGVETEALTPLLKISQRNMIRNLTEGFGDGGFFAEGDGPGSMSSHIVFLSALQAWRVAAGKDFLTPRPNARWTNLKYILLTIPRADGSLDFPKRGGYPHNVWNRRSISGAGYFAIGFDAVLPEQRAGMLWFYEQHLADRDEKAGTPFDTVSPYPHHAILAFLNWPFDTEPINPAQSIPRVVRDTRYGFYAFRNRWQDANDIVISQLTRGARGWIRTRADRHLQVRAHREKFTWGTIPRNVFYWQPAPDGSAIIGGKDGTWLAIDFRAASGADGLLIMTGPDAPPEDARTRVVTAGDHRFSIRALTQGTPPTITVEDDTVHIGGQSVWMDEGRLVLEKFAGPQVPWDPADAPAPEPKPRATDASPAPPSDPPPKPEPEPQPVSPEQRVASVRLSHARRYLNADRPDDARRLLQQIIERWPDTPAAEEAQSLLQDPE